MAIADHIRESMQKSSWIRKMFEEGIKLKAQFGEDNVFDFSLGNPDLDPPAKFFDVFKDFAQKPVKGAHGYMPNAGYPSVRKAIAAMVSSEQGIEIPADNIIMTCGAAGGLNTVLKTILNPGDDVVVSKPYFVEYNFYITNHNGVTRLAESNPDFSLNIENIRKAITAKTKAVLINSPNNPTGRVYPEQQIKDLSVMLEDFRKKGQTIYLLSDEPYREIIYDNVNVPSILSSYSQSIVVNSYSKSLSIPGERIGFIAANPTCDAIEELMAGMILCNRILGYVNAPALMQRIVAQLTDVTVDITPYRKRRDLLADGLKSAGYSFPMPEGAFYIYCKSPLADDVAFIQHLQKFNVLAVPGSGFGGPGYFRMAYCVPEDVIKRSIPKFKEAMDKLG
ncbi:MAG: pyridoxal phosphate-dependent aminotransferase [Spirochaetes bacterium]|nr:pyridoxal phosphate-dependent aminotransferase [Spirochaetota bacterium]